MSRRVALFGLALLALWNIGRDPSPAFGATEATNATVTIVERRTATSTDDAEEFAGGTMYVGSGDLELTHDDSDQTVGLHWTGLVIPRGAAISAAYIQFSAKESQSELTDLTIRGEAVDNSAPFAGGARNISTRSRTAAAARWSPVPWTAGQAGLNQRTPNLSAVIQEIVNRPGWTSGNALAIIITGTGHRTAWAFNGNASAAPLLHVEYGGTVSPNDLPPPDAAPVARLSVSVAASPPLTVTADGSASTDTDATPIASYQFDFGDGTPTSTTTAPTATSQHTYAAPGTYTVKLTATDTANLVSAPATKSVTVGSTTAPAGGYTVYAGYYDTHHPSNLKSKPSPWKGAAGVVFVGNPDGSSGGWDTSALRIDNLGVVPLTGVTVSVDMGSERFSLWGSNTIPAGGRLILAQTKEGNFDGSDLNPAGCYSCNPQDCLTKIQKNTPVVHVTIAGAKTDFYDPQQILNTRGVDAAGCPYTGTRNDESQPWQRIYSTPPAAAAAPGTSDGIGDDARFASTPARRLMLAPPSPNPARGELAVRFETATRGAVRLAVYDVSGRLVRMCLNEVLDEGEYVMRINLSGAASGIYFIKLSTAQGVRNQRAVLLQ